MSTEEFNYVEAEKKKKPKKMKRRCLLAEEIQEKAAADVKRRQYVKKQGVVDSSADCWEFWCHKSEHVLLQQIIGKGCGFDNCCFSGMMR